MYLWMFLLIKRPYCPHTPLPSINRPWFNHDQRPCCHNDHHEEIVGNAVVYLWRAGPTAMGGSEPIPSSTGHLGDGFTALDPGPQRDHHTRSALVRGAAARTLKAPQVWHFRCDRCVHGEEWSVMLYLTTKHE